jgi:alpha-ketoglutarate-dependent taurine dioxygenase
MLRDPRFQQFEVIPLTGALGAEIRGVQLAGDADAGVFSEVRRALDHYHVLAVRGQSFTTSAYHEVARRFGPFSGNPVHTPIEGYDDVVRFVREPDDTGMVAGENWHMDMAWMEKPPGITMLYGEVIPPVGGDTCFASLEHLYRALSPGMKSLLGGLTAIHSGKGVFAINAATTRLGVRNDNLKAIEELETEHPVICAHPVTARPYVFVSSVLQRFKGLTEAETKPIVDYLLALATRPEFTCRVRWEAGTLTMWANPFVLHTAINDYPGYRRVTYRTTVEGHVPARAAGFSGDAQATLAA